MSTINPTKVTRAARIAKVIAGIRKYFLQMPTLALGGTNVAPDVVVAQLQAVVDAIQKTSNTKAAWSVDVAAERDAEKAIAQVVRYIRAFATTQFGETQNAAQKLDDFGFTPRKARAPKVETQALAATKARATRAARGTKGSRQKAKIHGAPPATPTTGGTAAAAPAPAASPAPAEVKTAS